MCYENVSENSISRKEKKKKVSDSQHFAEVNNVKIGSECSKINRTLTTMMHW